MSDMQHEVVILSHSKDANFMKFHGNEEVIVVDSEDDARLIVNLLSGQIAMIKVALVNARASVARPV